MNDLLQKISSYNIFNYMLPGVLFAVLGTNISTFDFVVDPIILGLFVYYFYGLVVSRIGSLVVEPLLKKMGIVAFASYGDFISASQADSKLEVLSEANNSYRTLASLFLCLSVLILIDWIKSTIAISDKVSMIVSVVLVLLLFILSYRKQSQYITRRIENAIEGSSSESRIEGGGRDETHNK
jgi:hypothetical protein